MRGKNISLELSWVKVSQARQAEHKQYPVRSLSKGA